MKEEGNQCFREKRYHKAIELYTQSLQLVVSATVLGDLYLNGVVTVLKWRFVTSFLQCLYFDASHCPVLHITPPGFVTKRWIDFFIALNNHASNDLPLHRGWEMFLIVELRCAASGFIPPAGPP
ncbi:unnamed protein product [Angiostrongylus costaricensis]|uniref:TPR_REGION domain-containing protein n=1 Tax=Angiostrongylus costaricensis TaxID=334426 RepID=A0A0R3PAT3_ANGCS|nr:unnamed protein product [Angiostrongylus costaricensis]